MSNIDPSKPTEGQATTQSVRDNFQAAADEIDANAAAIAAIPDAATVFDAKLAGHLDTGLHAAYFGDLNDIGSDSKYYIGVANVTNEPADMATDGFITTSLVTATTGEQTIVGRGTTDAYRVWKRQLAGGVWDAWKLVVDGGAFPLRLAGYADSGLHSTFTGDADTILINSTYAANNQAITNGPPDADTWGFLTTELLGADSNFARQTFAGFVSAAEKYKVWSRCKSTTWNAWVLVVDGGAMSLRLAGYADTGLHAQFSDDLDDIQVNSTYACDGANTDNTPLNTGAFVVSTDMHYANTYGVQIAYGTVGHNYKIWERPLNDGVWGAWVLITDGAVSLLASTLPAELDASQLPTSLPATPGKVWNNGGVLSVS